MLFYLFDLQQCVFFDNKRRFNRYTSDQDFEDYTLS